MLYEGGREWLGWPQAEHIFAPKGAGPSACADYARRKIGNALSLAHPGIEVRVGILAPDPRSDATDLPLALICEFPRGAREEELNLAHRLAWNFSRTALLITLEPHRLLAWSCYQDPMKPEDARRVCELTTPDGFTPTGSRDQREVRDLLHWVSLVTGRVQRIHPEKFPVDGRADALLLKNLRHVRHQMRATDLKRDFCHDLLARVIFTQFLFHRKDSNGSAFFSERMMRRLHDAGTLSQYHPDLASVLRSKDDTYRLFRWMDERFNGDLFPGKEGDDEEAREAAWRAERDAVNEGHLQMVADLVAGNVDTTDYQLNLWPQYQFDTIPLEFISSVYEEFLSEDKHVDKAYYTPSHLVDYVLDAVLPWNGGRFDMRILDPSCGSGIFLVKAFQRLIHRWRSANEREPLVSDLKPILSNCLVGIDKNEEAVRVACFSLYLAMADAIEPRHYVTREKVFPRLRGSRLLAKDFFDEEIPGFRTASDADMYDLVLGNPPWGDGTAKSEEAKAESHSARKKKEAKAPPTKVQVWTTKNKWPLVNHDIGPAFLGKAAALSKHTGRVAMVQTASVLYWRTPAADKLRARLFGEFTFDEVTNLSALRRELFPEAVGPSCVLVFCKQRPSPDNILHYYAPKPVRIFADEKTRSGEQVFAIEPQDVHRITHEEAASDPTIWPLLALGGRRDLHLIRRLSSHPTLEKLGKTGAVHVRMGIIPGDRKKEVVELRGQRYFEAKEFPEDIFLELDSETVPKREKIDVDQLHGVVTLDAFRTPQLLIKQTLSAKTGRFRAALVKAKVPGWGVVCKKTYLSVSDPTPDARYIRNAAVVYNSLVAAYYVSLTSSRIGHYITESLTKELKRVPLPDGTPDLSKVVSPDTADQEARRLFALTAADWYLLEDFCVFTMPAALRKTAVPGRGPTNREAPEPADRLEEHGSAVREPDLSEYCSTFLRVLRATFGESKAIGATIYAEPDGTRLSVRMTTIHLNSRDRTGVIVERMEADGLLDALADFRSNLLADRPRATSGGLGFQRVAYFIRRGERAGAADLTVVKPDERRYWTRSMAMRDADQLTVTILKAARGEDA